MLGDGRVIGRGATLVPAACVAAWIAAACSGDAPGRQDTGASNAGSAAAEKSRAARMAERCDATNASVLIDSAGIGPVLLGTPVASLASRCTVTDTSITLSEGMPERAHVVTVAARPLLALSTGTPDTSIIRVITTDPAFRTSGGVGAGSSVEALRLAHGPLCAAQGEGNFVVTAAELPGVSFAIDWNPPPSREPSAVETPFPGGDPGTALDASRITRVWVHGVAGGCRVGVG
jgi:hypothetical protein